MTKREGEMSSFEKQLIDELRKMREATEYIAGQSETTASYTRLMAEWMETHHEDLKEIGRQVGFIE